MPKLTLNQDAALRFIGADRSYRYPHSWVSICTAVKLQIPHARPRFATIRALVKHGYAEPVPDDSERPNGRLSGYMITPEGMDKLRELEAGI